MSWIESIGTKSYTIKRATKSGGPYSIIARNVQQANYTDNKIKAGTTYYYNITASNKKNESENSYETAIAAGLPSPWKQKDIGNLQLNGTTSFDGKEFTVETVGKDLDSTSDEFHFTYQPLLNDGEIIARFVPQTSSQFSEMGLMLREGLNDNSPFVSLTIYPAKTADIELPDWRVKLITRFAKGESTDTGAISFSLSEPAVTWGRLTGYVWLRLQRKGDNFTASISYDGIIWKQSPDIFLSLNKKVFTGLSVSSGMAGSTTVFFDHVSIQQTK